VFKVVSTTNPKEVAACKSISKRKLLTPADVEDVRREVQILAHLSGHQNIVQLIECYEDAKEIHMVMQLCPGGELFDRIEDAGHFSEKHAARVMKTMINVVNHCHSMNVIHRDIKPENFLLASTEEESELVATDFGLSSFFREGDKLQEVVGSPYYVAPEVLQQQYNKAADVWSCGIVLYILLCGLPPFDGDSNVEIFTQILCSPLDLASDPWPKVSTAAKELVKGMLQRDPAKRLTVQQVLNHPWMKVQGVASDKPLEPEVLSRMKKFAKMNKLKKEALKVIASSLPAHELKGLREMFRAMDADNNGTITVEEMRKALQDKGAKLGNEEVRRVMESMVEVSHGDAKIDYDEFIAATLHASKVNRDDLLLKAFQHFDKDGSGCISQEELKEALAHLGEDVASVMREIDVNNDGRIDYEEFCTMMCEAERRKEGDAACREATLAQKGRSLNNDASKAMARVSSAEV